MTKRSRESGPAVEPSGFFALRTPLLPIDDLHAFGAGLQAPSADPAAPGPALAADRGRLRDRLRALLARPEIREAVAVASPSLDESLAIWIEQPESERGQKVEPALVRYFTRMCARPTPFGLFAGCSVGVTGSQTRLELEDRSRYRRHTRLDGDYLTSLVQALIRDPRVRRTLIYRPNSSLYRAAGRLRYAEARLVDSSRSYQLVAVDPTPPLEATIDRARTGATLDELVGGLVDDDVTREEAVAFVEQMIDMQLLVADLEPRVTGAEPVHELIAQLSRHPGTAPVAAGLAAVRAKLASLDETPLGAPPATYREIGETLAALPVPVELSRLFQVDLVKPARVATLGAAVTDEIVRAVSLLERFAPAPRPTALDRFREAFTARYDTAEVALTQVLDEESGVGFDASSAPAGEGSPLLEGLPLFFRRVPDEPRAGPFFALLLSRFEDALRSGNDEIVLEEVDLPPQGGRPPLPASFAAQITLTAPTSEALADGDARIFIHSVSGPSGANFLGRFCHCDAELERHVRAHLREEEALEPDAIFAEVVHLPEGRLGNVLLRPVLRDFELSYLGRSGASGEHQILLEDLMVSVAAGRIVLRSRRLDREILPRLTSAHAFFTARNLPAYRFLCALQVQGVTPALRFGWGALEGARFLPRVRVGRVILSLARWRLDARALKKLVSAGGDQRWVEAQALRKQLGLPRWVALADGDHVLPIDLDNVLSVETLAGLLAHRGGAILTEVLTHAACVSGPEGSFVHELVVPLAAARKPLSISAQPRTAASLPRHCPPGSDWLYAKLYTGSATADTVLREVIAPTVAAAREQGSADAWFFLRYSDPDWHLRVRFHGEPARLQGELWPALIAAAAPAVDRGQIWKVQLDTYQREIERYGGEHGLPLAEQLSCADSDAVLGIVGELAGDQAADDRWRITLRGIDQLLEDFAFPMEQRIAILQQRRDALAAELEGGPWLEKAIGAKFRKERRALESLLDRGDDADSPLGPALAILAGRSQRIGPIAETLRARAAAVRLTRSIEDLVGSFLHMHANRLLRAAGRPQELLICDFLIRLYQGGIARGRTPAR